MSEAVDYTRTETVHLHGETSKVFVWVAFALAYLMCAIVAFVSVLDYYGTGMLLAVAAALVNTGLIVVFKKGFFELHGDEHGVEEKLGNPTRRVFSHGWGWMFWLTRGIKRIAAKDSYAVVAYAALSYDKVPYVGNIVTASKISPYIVQRDGEWAGTARFWHIADDAAREMKRDQASEQVAEWVISGFKADEIHKTHDLQNMMLSGRLRLAAWDDFVRIIGVRDVDDARMVRESLDAPINPFIVIPWIAHHYLRGCPLTLADLKADNSLDAAKKARCETLLAFLEKLRSARREDEIKNRAILIELLRTEDADRDFSRYEYSAGEQFLPGCAFKDRTPAKSWAEAQERKASLQAEADAFREAADAAQEKGSPYPHLTALMITGQAKSGDVILGAGTDKVWLEKDVGNKSKKRGE